jgi:RNA polymerase sigma-70 factor (ECF subfamily)
MKGRLGWRTQPSQVPLVSLPPSPSPPQPTELRSGDVYRAHVQQVTRWVARLTGPGMDVEELVQEVFLRVHKLLPQFRGDAQLTTWLYAITQNVARSRRRRERFRALFRFGGELDSIQVASPRPTPVEELERRQSAELIYAALEGLSEKQRTVFILFEIDGRSGQEIAELTATKIETVWVQLSRAREQLAKRLEKLERRMKP